MEGRNLKVGIELYFDSMHLLPGHPMCGVPHGHTYKVEVVVEGPVQNGMVIDFGELKSHAKEVIARFDHKNLNEFLQMPSCENIASFIHRELSNRLPQMSKVQIRVWEGNAKFAECDGT